MSVDAEVIITGAGPAGTLAAYELAVQGVSVLIIEKSSFPRYKVCGAGLTHKILSEIPYDLSPVFETSIRKFRFSSALGNVFERASDVPLIYCTMRGKMDAFLLDKAIQAGAKVIHGEQVVKVEQEAGLVTCITRNRRFTSTLLIGAEGASGIVARSTGLHAHILQGLAWEAELRIDEASLRRISETVFLDWGTFPGGYAWLFPKADHISVGVGGPATLSAGMMPYYKRFLEYLSTEMTIIETLSLKSWPIPVRMGKSLFHNGRVVVAGDAVGLTDSMTGEGIYYAVRSGRLAANACASYLRGDSHALAGYSEAVNRELMSELTEAVRIKNLFNMVPRRIHNWIGESDRAWRAFGKILRGERNYADVRFGFGQWSFLWSITTFIAAVVYRIKEWRFKTAGFPLK